MSFKALFSSQHFRSNIAILTKYSPLDPGAAGTGDQDELRGPGGRGERGAGRAGRHGHGRLHGRLQERQPDLRPSQVREREKR